MIDIGRVCVKTAGREAGRFCVVVKQVDDTFVLITGPKSLTKVKRRRCNVDHLEALSHRISIKSDASDAEVEQALKKGDVLQKVQKEPAQKQVPEAALEMPEQRQELKKEPQAAMPVARPGFREAEKAIKAASELKASEGAEPETKKGLRHKLGLRRKRDHEGKKPEHKPKHEKRARKAEKKPKHKAEKKKPAKHKAAKKASKAKGKKKE